MEGVNSCREWITLMLKATSVGCVFFSDILMALEKSQADFMLVTTIKTTSSSFPLSLLLTSSCKCVLIERRVLKQGVS